MKLLLTSSGLSSDKLRKAFANLLERKVDESRVLVVHTVKNPKYMIYIDKTGKELSSSGVLLPNIDYLNIAKQNHHPELSEYDAVYICGGNTFFILDRIRKTGLAESLKKYVKSGGVYVGVSAGSIIAGPDIKIASWGSDPDTNDINLKDLTSLGFTDVSIYPHYEDRLKSEVDEFVKLKKYKVGRVKDGEGFLIEGKKSKLIKWKNTKI